MQEVAEKAKDDASYHLRAIMTPKIAELLGNEWSYFEQGILTPWLPLTHRHPQSILFKGKLVSHSPLKWGIKVEREGKNYFLFNCHLSYKPYQPFQLLKIPYENTPFFDTEHDAVQSALDSRQKQIEECLEEMKEFTKSEPNAPIFVTGDFNEPSHLDWTEKTASILRHPIKVEWPTTKILSERGNFIDCYRLKFPDEVQNAGNTWCTITSPSDPKDHHDRIDFVFIDKNHSNSLEKVELIGENEKNCNIVVSPYPSDHRAVLASFQF